MQSIKQKLLKPIVLAALLVALPVGTAQAATSDPVGASLKTVAATSQCGKGDSAVKTAIDFGCKGTSCSASDCSALVDVIFAIIRFLSNGVGLVIVGSIVFAGVQYTTSRGDPKGTELALQRIRSSAVALLIYIFAYAILNYIIPTGFLKT